MSWTIRAIATIAVPACMALAGSPLTQAATPIGMQASRVEHRVARSVVRVHRAAKDKVIECGRAVQAFNDSGGLFVQGCVVRPGPLGSKHAPN
jgi:hypothetical protein